MGKKIIVTRYPSVAEWLKRKGAVPEDTPVISRARPEDVEDCHVFGVLPVWLASFAERVTEYVVVSSDADLATMTVDEIGQYIRRPLTYEVRRIEEE